MNLVSTDQNAKLKDAGSKRIDTSPRVGKSVNLSAQVSSSKLPSGSVVSDNKRAITTPNSKPVVKSDQMKGSYEGYMRSAPAYVQPNNAGYDNAANQQARYSKKTMQLNNKMPAFNPILNNMNKSAIIDNYSNALKKNSSGDRLKKMNNVERMF
jgi:hypothetical protein